MRKKQKFLPCLSEFVIIVLVARLVVVLGQTTCNNGQGRVLYERLPNQQLQGFDDDVVRDTAPPFRVLEKCQDLCLRDRTASNNLVRACTSFDFQPGSRIASFSGSAEYEESTCYLTREQAAPEGIGNLMLVPNSVHFTEICLTSSRPERECPSRRYVFERHPRKKLKLPVSDIKEITAANRSDCEDKCLNEFSFVCRSANFDSTLRSCTLSRFTRRTHPELLEDDPNSDYLENTCLNAERRCDGLIVFVKEENKRLGGPFEVDIFNNMTLEECQSMCLRAEKYFCRSIEFDDQTKQCIVSEEDSISQKDDLSISSSPTHHFYDLVCLDNQRGTEYPDNSVTSHLFSNGRRPDTAFQRYRNSRLGGEFHSEITGRSLSECLDECLRQTSFQCRSAVYSDRFRTCRLSRYNQRDGMRIIYDADYDYYENLMLGGEGGEPTNGRPDPTDWRPPYSGGDRDRFPDDRIPGGRYPPVDNKYPPATRPSYGEKYPIGGDRYPPTGMGDRYPGGGSDRYPPGGPSDRYPPGGSDRYPPGASDRYPPGGSERYPPSGSDRYPPSGSDRYPPSGSDRYPPGGSDRYPSDRYPPSGGSDRYPIGMPERYPSGGSDRYPPDRYPMPDRYPSGPAGDRYPGGLPDRYPSPMPDDGRYPSVYDNRYPSEERYPDRGRFPMEKEYYDRPSLFPDTRHPPSRGYPADRYPERTPYEREPSYGGRMPPSRPLGERPSPTYDRGYVSEPAYSGGRPYVDRMPPDSRYPPDTMPDRRYPSSPSSYPPTSDNRFPVGNERYPIDIYKYGNRERYPTESGYDRYAPAGPPPTYYERGYGDRFGSMYPGGNRMPSYDRGYSRPPFGAAYPPYEPPYAAVPPPSFDGSINQVSYSGSRPGVAPGGPGPVRPFSSPCGDGGDGYKQVAIRQRMRRQYIKRVLAVPNLTLCERECSEARDFICRSFNYRDVVVSYETDREGANCELSDRDTREADIQNPGMFDTGSYDYYERNMGRSGDADCLDVSQVCNEDGMEFTLRTPEGFIGRIYTYGFYDRCFFRGNGGTANVLRISGPQGYPECGTQRYGDTMTNIVVVQFSDNVQTGKDKRFNLTCLFRGPGEAIVTSGYIGAGSGSPIPIEYLPAENTLSSKVRLMILYQGRPTTTIAVGDPLTFRLESQDGYNQVTDMFATNVIARDPYSGRSVQLIDRYGCPVDTFVFPELGRARDGDSLEARFNAFKIPESNFLVFEATVRTCRDGCQPAYCAGPSGRSEPSFGRRKRDVNGTIVGDGLLTIEDGNNSTAITPDEGDETTVVSTTLNRSNSTDKENETPELPEQVREMIEVFESREEMQLESVARKIVAPQETICITPSEYHGLISAVILLLIILISITLLSGFAYRRYWNVMSKNHLLDRTSPINSFSPSALHHMNISNTNNQFHASGRNDSSERTSSSKSTAGLSLFNGGLHKTFATGNLSRMCQIPVMNPIRNNGNTNDFDDPSEPIYTDPSLFERSRSLRSIAVNEV